LRQVKEVKKINGGFTRILACLYPKCLILQRFLPSVIHFHAQLPFILTCPVYTMFCVPDAKIS